MENNIEQNSEEVVWDLAEAHRKIQQLQEANAEYLNAQVMHFFESEKNHEKIRRRTNRAVSIFQTSLWVLSWCSINFLKPASASLWLNYWLILTISTFSLMIWQQLTVLNLNNSRRTLRKSIVFKFFAYKQ